MWILYIKETCAIFPFHFQTTLAISDKELCKYFEPGNHVKVVSGSTEGATGMVVSVEGHVVNIVSDTTKELVSQSSLKFLLLFC